MSRSAQIQISLTKDIRFPNHYIQAIYNEYKREVLDEATAPKHKGQWRQFFSQDDSALLHLEIGPGNGKHFAQLCLKQKKDCFLSIELKYKALIQTARRIKKNNSKNGRVIRYNARLIEQIFEDQELNNIYIHFPDPWMKKKKQKKHQLIQNEFCQSIYKLQKKGSFLDFKTDSEIYFHQSVKRFQTAGYKLERCNLNLHKNQIPEKGFMNSLSQFELLFFQKQIPIQWALFIK